jgi:hypothetical protein
MMLLRRRKTSGDFGRAERYRRRLLLWKAIELRNSGTLSDDEFDSVTSRLTGDQPVTDVADLDAGGTRELGPSAPESIQDNGQTDRGRVTPG